MIALLVPCLAAAEAFSLSVVQTGAYAGVRNKVFTRWVAGSQAFAGVSGSVSLQGNARGFSEALVMLGTLPAGQAACATADRTDTPAMPAISRLWAGILKSNDTAAIRIPVGVTLPDPVALPRGGACLAVLVSAGYPFLRRDAALYTSTAVTLSVRIVPSAGQAVQAFGIGGEFRLPTGAAVPPATYVGLQALHPLILDGVAVSLSAAPVSGAPAMAGWMPGTDGTWRVVTNFVFLPAASCRAAHLAGHPAGADFSVLRSPGPVTMGFPPGGVLMLPVPLASRGDVSAQANLFYPFGTPGWLARMAPGDCLIAQQTIPGGGPLGVLDVENQSTLYLH